MAPGALSLLGRPQMHARPMPVHHARNLTPRGLHATSSRLFCSRGCRFPDSVHPRLVEDRRGQTGKTACPHSPTHSSVPATASPGHTKPTRATLVTTLTTDPRARSGRREACRRTTPTTDQGLGALCHARLRPAWLRCGPVSFPRAAGRHRGAEINAVITHAGVWHRRRERPSDPWLGAELTERQ